MTWLTPARVLAAVVVVAALCNVGKAVHIDDTAYLEMARGILVHPLKPMSTEINWDQTAEPAYNLINTPPLVPYLLAGTMLVAGDSELALHGMMAVISAFVLITFYRLATRVAPGHARLVTALLALSPAFLPGQNLMTDVPLLAAWLACLLVLVRAEETPDRPRYALAGAAIAVACLIKYTSLVLIPIVAITLVYRRRYKSLWILAIPTLALAGWCAWNYVEFGAVHLLTRPKTFRLAAVGPHILEWFAGIGVAAPFGLMLLFRRVTGVVAGVFRAIPLAAGAIVFASTRTASPEHPQLAWLWGIFVGIGLTILLSIGEHLLGEWRTRTPGRAFDQSLMLSLCLLGAAGFTILLTPFMAMRHVLLAVPAALLLTAQSADGFLGRRGVPAACVVLTASLGIALAVSDYRYANVYRKYSVQAARAIAPGTTVWAVGHWGFQWYAYKGGLRPYDRERTNLQPGDYVVLPHIAAGQDVSRPDQRRLREVTRVEVGSTPATYLRTMGWNGSYYAYFWESRTFPFVFTTKRLEVFRMCVVDR